VELTRQFAWGVRVRVDDEGVTRRGLLSRRAMRWEEIDDNRIEVRMPSGAIGRLGELAAALSGTASLVHAIELRSGVGRLRIDSFFDSMPRVIGVVLARIGDRLTERALAGLRQAGTARFGPLRLAPHALQWADREPLARERVEAIDLLDTSPVRLRVLERGRILAHGSAATSKIPTLHAALAIARELGYPVRDGEVVRVLDARPASVDGADG
jgi:hypothetical protein